MNFFLPHFTCLNKSFGGCNIFSIFVANVLKKEGNKERIQQYKGVVIQRKGNSNATATFTVRKMSGEIGVERIFPLASPFIEKIEVNKYGKVRRSRIFYFRSLTGKKARIAERKFSSSTV